MSKNLFKDFKENSLNEWQEKIVKDLKGKDFNDTVVWESEIGSINPILFDYKKDNSIPTSKSSSNSWNIQQSFDAKDPIINTKILEALKGGVNSIFIQNISAANLENTLSGVMIEIIDLHMDVSSKNYKSITEKVNQICEGLDKSAIRVGFNFDPISFLTRFGHWNIAQEEDFHSLIETLELTADYTHVEVLKIDASIYGNAGANIEEQIAYALAHANEYLNYLHDNNIDLNETVNKISFRFSVGTSYFLEIAKLRAFRKLWSIVVNEYCNKKDVRTNVTAVNSTLYYSHMDEYNNMLRGTTAGMSAAIAGYDTIEIVPYNVDENNSFANRIAKNVQLILQEESHLDKVIDPSYGSYYIEEITNKLISQAWDKFKQIEKEGGFIASLQNEKIQKQIASSLQKKKEVLADGRKTMIGVNKFVNKNETHSFPPEQAYSLSKRAVITPIRPSRLAEEFEKVPSI